MAERTDERPVWVLLQARPSSERGDIEPSRVIGVFDDPEDIPARLQFMARTVPYSLQQLGETCWRIGPEEQEGFFGFEPRTYYAVRATLTETTRVTRRDAAPEEAADRG